MIRLGLLAALAVAILVGPVAGIGVLVGWGIADLIVALWRLGVFGLKADAPWSPEVVERRRFRVDVRPERRR
jgi:hypothetical protein